MPTGTQKFLDNQTGLPTLWAKIKEIFVAKEAGKGLSTNDFTNAYKDKLDGLDGDAMANQNAFSNVKVGETTITASAETDTVSLVQGANVTLTADAGQKTVTIAAADTTYSEATTGAAGLMSATDKTKLDGIANNANNYVHPTTSGNKHIPSGGASGNALMWSADGTGQWATIQQSNVSGLTNALNGKLSTTGTAAAASKLATGRTFQTNLSSTTAVSFDGSANNVHGVTGTLAIANGGTGATSAAAARTALGAAASDHTHDNATQETSGFMSNTDKAKLDELNPDAIGGGFVQFDADSDIPVEQRVSNTLYGRILVDYTS